MYEISITDKGRKLLAASVVSEKIVIFSEFKISSEANDLNLEHVVYSSLVNRVETNTDEIWVNCIIPEEANGFWLRYLSLLDNKGNVIAQGNIPEYFKADNQSSFIVSDYTVKLKYDNAQAISLSFNSSAYATVQNYYQLAQNLIQLTNQHSSLFWKNASKQANSNK